MEIERGRVLELIASVAVVLTFVGIIIAIGQTYNTDASEPGGGLIFVGAIAGFVIVMSIVGIVLAYVLNEE